MILLAVNKNGLVLKDIGNITSGFFKKQRHNENKQIVLAAVTQNGLALEYASDKLKSDQEIVTAAIQQNSEALKFASKNLQNQNI